jgi:hypothetical protein
MSKRRRRAESVRSRPVFDAQALTYLRVTKLEVSLVINFNVEALKFGVKRVVKKFSVPPRFRGPE